MRQTREILRQKWSLGRTHREVAQSLGISNGAVGTTVLRARAAGLDWAQVDTLSQLLRQRCELLPPHTAYATRELLEQVESLDRQVIGFEHRIKSVFKPTLPIQLLTTVPGVGLTLAVVIALEIGDVTRFPTAEKLTSYAGCTCRVHASGDKQRYKRLRPDVNRYLKWAFIEAANAICLMRRRHPHRHVTRLYERIARRKGHPKAIGAVARHLAEATYWLLSKQEAVSRAAIVSRFVDRG